MKSVMADPEDKKLYRQLLKQFSKSEYISTAKIQRVMKVSYLVADQLLNRFIADGLASPKVGSWPSVVLRGSNKKKQIIHYEALIHEWSKPGRYPDPKIFLE